MRVCYVEKKGKDITLFIMSKQSNTKWDRRDRKRHKKKYGMRISGRSIFLLEELLFKKLKRKKKDDGKEEKG